MNILPKKRWHVLTKENIARVRQDEAKFHEEQRQIQYRAQLAEQESRTESLRKRKRTESIAPSNSSHVSVLVERSTELIAGNKEYEIEKKTEKEKQEKAIGLLTYLGQSVLETGGKKPWYDVHPKQLQTPTTELSKQKEEWEAKKKAKADPLTEMNKVAEWFEQRREEKAKEESKNLQRANSCISAMPSLFPNDIAVPKGSKLNATSHRNRRSDKHSSKTTNLPSSTDAVTGPQTSDAIKVAKQLELDRLRAERLQRERKERERAALIMAKAMGLSEATQETKEPDTPTDERDLPFNSAFNPELSAALAERRRRHRESKRRYHVSE